MGPLNNSQLRLLNSGSVISLNNLPATPSNLCEKFINIIFTIRLKYDHCVRIIKKELLLLDLARRLLLFSSSVFK